MHWRRKWQPTPVFLPGESQGQGNLVGCRLWGHTELDMSERLVTYTYNSLSVQRILLQNSNYLKFFFNFYFYFILLYNTVLVLPYIDMNLPWVYMSSQTWTPLPPPTPYHLSGSSQCTSPKHPVSCIEHRLAIHFLHDSIHVSIPFSLLVFD